MCEMLALQSAKPFELGTAFQLGLTIEKFGIARFGWGVSWVQDGVLQNYRSELGLGEDVQGRQRLAGESATSCLIHLRRPSFLSTIAVENSQPYLAEGEFAFGHNGYLADHVRWREVFAQVVQGQSDSEMGFHLYKQRLVTEAPADAINSTLRDTIGRGEANVIVLNRDESLVAAGSNERNPMYWFAGADFTGIVTGLHSLDQYLFTDLLTWVEQRTQIRDAVYLPKMTPVHA
ncbi:class II glutamine amidotransferase [Alicyclobacillus sp. ALC3]|uniref:class II glutamine amidotransferase n=1 Tax=Alicyclobacillus sp. ALC3 TaxID=2796143 RepID=UPI002379131D|nr:class II glutamine amidotransferase [Alicyclobacillus sp. ALC3]WDL97618.1 class II glutamine amidotransferase [Alicyclobacillus sp. ALC3]